MTIRAKLTLLIMTTSALSVIAMCLLFYYLIGLHLQESYQKDLGSLADILGHNCTAALTFNVPEDATAILQSIDSRASVLAIRLYDRRDHVFAAYDKEPGRGGLDSPPQPLPDTPGHLKIERDITLKDGTRVGRLVLYDDRHDIAANKRKGVYILLTTGFVALAGAFVLASLLQGSISRPLHLLTEAVQRLATGDFSARHLLPPPRTDEIGVLSTAVVHMSQKLEDSYSALEASNKTLEKRVASRTKALQLAMEELSKSQVQLVQSEKMVAIGHLVAGVAHEINNNISFISCAIPSIIRENQKINALLHAHPAEDPHHQRDEIRQHTERIESLLHNAEEGVKRTTNIVKDLNTFSRPSQGEFTKVNIHQEIEMVLTLLRYDFKGRIEVQRDFAPDLPPVFCLRDQMNQVYMNILRNASQAVGDSGTIRIQTRREGDTVLIRFQDNGQGIPPEIQAMIFDPFFSTKEVGKGTGLGLSISYGIMASHGGEIRIEDSGPHGTCFLLTLPLGPHRRQPVASPTQVWATQSASSSRQRP